jgi:hypothetical protein
MPEGLIKRRATNAEEGDDQKWCHMRGDAE